MMHRYSRWLGVLCGVLWLWCVGACTGPATTQEPGASERTVRDGGATMDQGVRDRATPQDTNSSLDRGLERSQDVQGQPDPGALPEQGTEPSLPESRPEPSPDRAAPPERATPPERPAPPDTVAPQCGEIRTFATGKKPSVVLYVSSQGKDQGADGTRAKPYKTVQAAAKRAKPGTAIRILPGRYGGSAVFLYDLKGTVQAPIWVGGEPGKTRPVFEGGSEGIHLVRPQYVVLHDLEIRKARSNGVNCDDGGSYKTPKAASYVEFRRLWIHDVGGSGNQDCLKLSGLYHYYVLDSQFARCGGGNSGSGVDHVGCHHGLIARNRFEQLSGNAVQNKGGSTDIEIRWNVMKDSGVRAVNMGGSTGLQYFRPPVSKSKPNAEARDIRVIGNIIQGSEAPVAYVGCVDCLAAHNTIIDPGKWVARILQETKTGGGYTFLPASKSRFVNNIVYFKRSRVRTFVNIGPNTDAKSFTFAHNLWYAYDNPGQSKPSLPVAEQKGVVGQDPKFEDAAKGKYGLRAGSPAIGKGMSLKGVKADRAGKCYAVPPSIGAYEGKR